MLKLEMLRAKTGKLCRGIGKTSKLGYHCHTQRKRLIVKKLIKRIFKLFDRTDFETAVANVGNAKDREDFEWKLRNRLFYKEAARDQG